MLGGKRNEAGKPPMQKGCRVVLFLLGIYIGKLLYKIDDENNFVHPFWVQKMVSKVMDLPILIWRKFRPITLD